MTLFDGDPVIGKLIVTTVELDHEHYRAMIERIKATAGLARNLEPIDDRSTFGLPVRPYKLTATTPKIVRVLYRTLTMPTVFPISISSYEYITPGCSDEELYERLRDFLRQPNLPDFLILAREGLVESDFEDTYKLGEIIFTAGLNAHYSLERV